jgi:hypothetical protein
MPNLNINGRIMSVEAAEGDHARRVRNAYRLQRRQRAEGHMKTHVKITHSASADLSRRSFLVGSAATGLVLGYAAVPGIGQALAAPSAFEPSVWDGLVPSPAARPTWANTSPPPWRRSWPRNSARPGRDMRRTRRMMTLVGAAHHEQDR